MNVAEYDHYYIIDDQYCDEHGARPCCILEINGVFVPLCQQCVDELIGELSQFATKEATK